MAFGTDLPNVATGVGFRTKFGPVVLEPGARVAAYVRSTGAVSDDDAIISTNLVTTLAAGLARCRSGKNDVVFVLPGHSESVTDGTTFSGALVAGTRIIGCGYGSNRPVFRWTATASQWSITKADVMIANLKLLLEGAVVVKAIVSTAANTSILGCEINTGTTASTNLATIAIEMGLASDNFTLVGNYIHGIPGATSTKIISVVGVSDGITITDNKVMSATSVVSVGLIDITAAATGMDIGRNLLQNRLASSETCISVNASAATGVYYDNYGATEAGTPVSDIFEANAASLLRPFQNFGTDTKGASGLLSPAIVT